jgi:alanine racemase
MVVDWCVGGKPNMVNSQVTAQEILRQNRVDSFTNVSQGRAWVEIDLDNLAHNVRQIKKILGSSTELMAVVKADAYGHGAVTVAQIALRNGATCLAIATLAEGIELRQAGITAPILILGAINTPEEIAALVSWQLEPTLCSPEQALLFGEIMASMGQTLSVHLKLDTGMSRLGTNWQQAVEFVRLVAQFPQLKIASIYSHLATADDPDSTVMQLQHERFRSAIAAIQANGFILPRLHLANSAATLQDCALHYDLVRVGLALYGLYPASRLSSVVNLKPVLQVKAKIAQVKIITAGTGVSYGHHFVAPQDMPIAIVGIGYADGVPRNLSSHLQVLVRGRLVSQIGTITMDQLMLDIRTLPDLQVGEIVTLIGQDGDLAITADDWATTLKTISWEILCGFKHRLPRIHN